MSSFDKVVKLACKPKPVPPKAKYIDPIIAATWSDDGAVHDVCKALVPRLREPNAVVVFKALIVLHTMIRNGATDNVLSYLSQSNVLRLRNIASASWEGYAAPQNLQNFAIYLEARIVAYQDIKHDAIKVQAESNRDMRNSQSITSIEEDAYKVKKDKKDPGAAPSRSKTIVGRKLRVMTVEKGLLRETKVVHKMIDALVECRFYLDDLEDELTITALRMLVKDLLILFQAGNEGVINVLEHYFEMSHTDASEALAVYRHFCKQTESVVEYLGVAKKLQNLLNVPVPNLKHAPVSLAGALQEYLEDPNFESNRREYRANKAAADGGGKKTKSSRSKPDNKTMPPKSPPSSASASTSNGTDGASSSASTSTNGQNKDVLDFFAAIEGEQPSMFNPSTNSPSTAYFQQQGAVNPFSQMPPGQPFALSAQQTGFLVPQMTAMPGQGQPNPFGGFLTAQPTAQPGHRPFSSYLPQQASGMGNGMMNMGAGGGLQVPGGGGQFLQPQTTGAPNPFRQSMLVPQTTGMQLFGVNGQGGPGLVQSVSMGNMATGMGMGQQSLSAGPMMGSFGQQQQQQQSQPFQIQPQPTMAAPRPAFVQDGSKPNMNSFSQFGSGVAAPARPASTPLTSSKTGAPVTMQAVKTHQTGTKNPFGPVSQAVPPVPKAPTLFELNMEKWGGMQGQNQNQNQGQQGQQQQQNQQQPQQTGSGAMNGMNGFNFANSALNPGPTDISSVASSFTFANKPSGSASAGSTPSGSSNFNPLFAQNTATTNMTGTTDSFFGLSLSSQPTGATTMSSFSSGSSPGVQSHTTGLPQLKAFKPTSSFGASLMGSLPSIPGSAPTTPSVTGLPGPSGTSSAPTTNSSLTSTNSAPSSTAPSVLPSPTSQPGSNFNPNGTSSSFSNNTNFMMNQPTGAMGGFGMNSSRSTLGVGLRPQMTGGGAANPFRASSVGTPNFGGAGMGSVPPMPNGMQQQQGQQQPFGNFGMMGGASPFGMMPQQQQQNQQQNGTASLI
ncbi:ANTH domain-containing protein [Crepidotus variabilis]|uniref:ANTH domain-containing protein n=1 Tax=Crepidotus variabilis TaxID=179855 RepID=A0A9P6JSV7_9AGAR|nr:ANTH domain-containing protein [Crepidotus variabilis]